MKRMAKFFFELINIEGQNEMSIRRFYYQRSKKKEEDFLLLM